MKLIIGVSVAGAAIVLGFVAYRMKELLECWGEEIRAQDERLEGWRRHESLGGEVISPLTQLTEYTREHPRTGEK